MIILVICENQRDLLDNLRNPPYNFNKKFDPFDQVTINYLNRTATTKTNTYIFVTDERQLLSVEAHDWELSANARHREDLETIIKIAMSRCRLHDSTTTK